MRSGDTTLVIGADGTIGRALVRRFRQVGRSVVCTSRRRETGTDSLHLDLAEDVSGWRPPPGVSVAYLCAAITSLEKCRTDPAHAALVNVQHTVAVARRLVEAGAFVVFLSTNLVYDGSVPFRRAEEPVCPRTVYGTLKARAESQLLALGGRVAVVRLTKVVAPGMALLRGWVQALGDGKEIRPFSDLVMAPVPLGFVVEVLDHVGQGRRGGIVQVSAERDISYAEAGRYVAAKVAADLGLVRPVPSSEAGVKLEGVPAHTTLDVTRLRESLGLQPPPVWQAVDSVLGA
jgi:dTDP-4-dehydrorhamnose reductase